MSAHQSAPVAPQRAPWHTLSEAQPFETGWVPTISKNTLPQKWTGRLGASGQPGNPGKRCSTLRTTTRRWRTGRVMPRSIETRHQSTRLVPPRTGTPARSNANAGTPDNSRPASEETDATMVELDRKTQHEIRDAVSYPGSTKSWTQHEISGRNPRIHNGMKAAHCPKCPPTTRLS